MRQRGAGTAPDWRQRRDPDQVPDQDILENRLQAFIELPWIIPALTIIEMTDEDLDLLDAAGPDEYWPLLNGIVGRIQETDGKRGVADGGEEPR